MARDSGNLLAIEDAVNTLDQVDIHHRIVGVVVLAHQALTLRAFLVVDQVGELGREHFVDERAVVRRLQRRTAQDQVDLYRWIAVVEVDESFGGTLSAADDRDFHRLAVDTGLLEHALQILRMVEDPAIVFQVAERQGMRGVPPALTTTERVVRTSSSPSALREVTRSASTLRSTSIGSTDSTSSP